MNKHLYRLVFNRSLGLVQIASELATGSGGEGVNAGGRPAAVVRALSFALWAMLGFVSVVPAALSQVVADPAAAGNQQPTVLTAPNGVPLINIQTPSAAGVSRNVYSAFNVDNQGVILNNSRTNVQTQMGGWVQGNPWLATSTAKVILNEVNSANPSYLQGYVEVAGSRAQVVIANPAGISVNGGGFINASRVTLTTGTPMLGNGTVDGYRVQGGAIVVDGAGLDTSSADYTDVITRSLQLNGGLWANQLQATLGTNVVSADHTQVTATTPVAGTAPMFALDASALGGMYSGGKITLLGTEQGVGVRNAGTLGARAGDLIVTIDGRLENSDALQSNANTQVSAAGGVANAGTLSAARELTIDTPLDVDNSGGTLNAQRIEVNATSLRNRGGAIQQTGVQALALNAGTLSNRDGGRIAVAEPISGGGTGGSGGSTGGGTTGGSTGSGGDTSTGGTPVVPLAVGALNIARLLDNDAGRITAGGGIALDTSNGLNNDGGQMALARLSLDGNDLSNVGGTLDVIGDAQIDVNQVRNDTGDLTVGGALDLSAQAFSNRGGEVLHSGTDPTAVQVIGTFDNTDGRFASNADTLAISTGTIVNANGRLEQAGTGGMSVQTGTLSGAGGTIATAGALTMNADQVDHQGANLNATQMAITANGFDNRGGSMIATGIGVNTVAVAGTFDNGSGGTIASNGDLQLQAQTLGNAGGTVQHAGTGTLAIDATTIKGPGGTLASNGTLTVAGETVNLRDGTTQAQRIAVDAGTLATAGGTLTATSTDALQLQVRGVFDNTAGAIGTNGVLAVTANSLVNRDGSITAAGTAPSNVAVATTFDNTNGVLASSGALTVAARDLINQGGTLRSASTLTVTADGRLDNSTGGTIASGDDLTLSTPVLDNTNGTIQQAGDGVLAINAATVNGAGGTIASNGALTLIGETTDLRNATTLAQRIAIDTGTLTAGGTLHATGGDALVLNVRQTLDNTAGDIGTNGALALTANQLVNRDGTLQAAGTAPSKVTVTGTFDNTGGALQTNGATGVQAGALVNANGTVQTPDALQLAVDGVLDNQAGLIASGGNGSITATTFDNRSGTVNASGTLDVAAVQGLDNASGVLASTGDLAVRADTLTNTTEGVIASIDGNATVTTAGRIDNGGGIVQSAGTTTVTSSRLGNAAGSIVGANVIVDTRQQALDNVGGTIAATAGTLNVHSGALNNDAGLLQSAGAMAVDTAGQTFTNTNASTAGGIISGGTLGLTTGDLDNRAGVVYGQGAITARTAVLDNTGGLFAGATDVQLDSVAVRNTGGTMQAGQNVAANVGTTFDNTAGLVLAGGELAVNAQTIVNRDTISTDPAAPLGLQADTVTLAANRIDNTAGLVAADTAIAITGTGAGSTLDNTQGMVSSAGTVDITTSTITNTAGTLLAGTAQTITADSMTGDGRVLSQGDLTVALQQDFVNTGEITANDTAQVSTAGTLTNQSTIQAGDLTVSAVNVDNAAAGEISGGRTHVVATNTVTNRGLIDGTVTRIDATTVDNVGTGRIYGDHLSIGAGTVTNREETVNGSTSAGTIASRGRLDIGAGTVINREDALIFSAGSTDDALNIGGALDADGLATGRADLVHNASATIESLGGLAISATTLRNTNEHFVVTEGQTGTPTDLFYIQPKGDPNMYLGENFVWEPARPFVHSGRYVWNTDPAPNASTELGVTPMPRVGAPTCSGSTCTRPAGRDYPAGDPAWSYFGITEPDPEPVAGDYPDQASFDAAHAAWQAQTDQRYADLDAQIASYNNDFASRSIVDWTQYEVTQTETGTQVTQSEPALIRSGGNIWLTGDTLINDKSQIIAGGALLGDLNNLQNIDATGESRVHQEGTSQYSHQETVPPWRGLYEREWDSKVAYTPADEITTTSLNVVGVQQNTNSTGSGYQVAAVTSGTVDDTASGSTAGLDGRTAPRAVAANATTVGPATLSESIAPGSGAGASTGPAASSGTAVSTSSSTAPGSVTVAGNLWELPTSSLFRTNTGPGSYLIETDPRFTNYRNWLSSDYMLGLLGLDPANMHKRLGDGFYEQRLIRDQIAQLTGLRFLEGYASDEEQYRALLENGATFAQQWSLRPGVGLSAAQIAQLTSDIVWLVEETVRLPDGTLTTALVPRVYLRPRAGDLNGNGTLISADAIGLDLDGDLVNGGTIAGRTAVQITADNIRNLGGRITAADVRLHAMTDFDNIGGTVDAADSLIVTANSDINMVTTTQSDAKQVGQSDFSRTNIDRVAGLYVTNPGGTMVLLADGNVNADGVQIVNAGEGGQTYIGAHGNINLGTVTVSQQNNTVADENNFIKQGYARQVGTTVQTTGDVTFDADNFSATAAHVTSEQGSVTVVADGTVDIRNGEATQNWSEGHQVTRENAISSATRTSVDTLNQRTALGSTFSGETVTILGDKVGVQGSNVVSTYGTTVTGTHGVEIVNATNEASESHDSNTETSGVFAGSGGLTLGSQKKDTQVDSSYSTAVDSMVGSLKGNTHVSSEQGVVHVKGSTVSSLEGDVAITGQAVNIEEAFNTSSYKEINEFQQSGLTVGFSSSVVDAALAASGSARTVGQSNDSRVNAMAAANAAYDTYQAGQAVASAMNGSQAASLSLTVGSQQSRSEVTANTREVVGSSVQAGGVVDITATGAGDDSTIRVSGSEVYGDKGANLTADGAIDIVAAHNTYEQQTENSSAGWNAGVAITVGPNRWGAGFTAGANVGRGGSDGQTVTNVNSHVGSGGTTTVTSGGTTTIGGGQVTGNRVEVSAAELVIESLQDTQTYESDQMDASVQATVGFGASVSGSYSQSEIDANYASVTEQSGILAGDGGYAVNVKGKTDLAGGIVTSTQPAEDADRNSFTTGTLTTSNIENHADYEGSSFGISGSVGKNGEGEKGEHQTAQGSSDGKAGGTSASKSFGFGSDSDHQNSTTYSGINTRNITITDVAGQAATGQTAEQIKTEVNTATTTDNVAENSGALTNRFDAADVQKELDLQAQVTQAFDQNRQEAKAELYAYAKAKQDQARKIRMANGGVDTEESKQLDEEAAGIKKTAMWLDIAAMGVHAGPDMSNLLVGETLTQIDLVRRAATPDSKIMLQQCEANGQNCTKREVDLKDVAIGKDGKIYIFNNGIFNQEDYALATGAKQNSNEANSKGVYYILNPYTGNPVAEMLYAGYDKLNDLLGGVLPLTGAERANQSILDFAKKNDGIVDSVDHSRGAMTLTNAIHDLSRQGKKGQPIGSVLYNGAAANAREAADLIQNISQYGKVFQSTHQTDIVGVWIGGNPATSDKNDGSFPNSHSSYTGYLPPEGTFIQVGDDPKNRINLRDATDKNWGNGNHSVPVYVPPTKPKSSSDGDGT